MNAPSGSLSRRKIRTTVDGRLAEDPVRAHVVMDHDGRQLLGEVTRLRMVEVDGERLRVLTVRHFNGEPWPLEPYFLAVDVLDRNWDNRGDDRRQENRFYAQPSLDRRSGFERRSLEGP